MEATPKPSALGIKHGAILAGLVVAAFLVRILAVQVAPRDFFWLYDSYRYWWNTRSLATEGGLFSSDYPVGYSMVLMPWFMVGGEPHQFVLWIHSALGAVLVAMAFAVTRACGGRRTAWFAAAVVAFHPSLIRGGKVLMNEIPFTVLLFLGLMAVYSARRGTALLAGLLLGFAAEIRPVGVAIVLALGCWMLTRRDQRRRAAVMLCSAASVMLVMSAWITWLRGEVTIITPQFNEAEEITADWGYWRPLSADEILARGSYLHHAWAHPSAYLNERLMSAATLLSPWPFLGGDPAQQWSTFLADGVILLFALWAVSWGLRYGLGGPVWSLCITAAAMIAFYAALYSDPRYRVPMIPCLVCFSCAVLTAYHGQRGALPEIAKAPDAAARRPAAAAE